MTGQNIRQNGEKEKILCDQYLLENAVFVIDGNGVGDCDGGIGIVAGGGGKGFQLLKCCFQSKLLGFVQ